ncbi:hypothetical protein OE88DRAFT_1303055 [Heliocybe sulcata]|uniref:BTB domain-containing protein n=1 Tax=Heliocybe sulcata TaxID=5364 RepID=A0A5C3N4T6_9AGAM|nr:hypothetical protein OE88DRAFT_1303055 [Heliocybe sulcata]
MAKGAEEMIEELEAEDLLRTPKSTRKKSRSQSLKKSPSKNAMESSAPRTPGTPATRSSASKAGQAAGTAQKKGPTGSSDSPTKTPRHSMAIFPSSSSSATGSKSTPSSATSSKSTRPSASQATPRSSEVRVKVEGAAKKKHSSMRTSFSSVSDYTWLLESTRDAVSGSISSLEAWKRARAGTKDKSSDMSSSAPSQAMDKAKAPATPTSANAVPVSSAAAPASPGAGTPAAPQTSQNPSTSSASPTSTRRAARLTRTPRPYVFLSSDLQSGSVGTVDPSSSTGTVATESSNYMSAQSTVSIEQAQATSHSAKKDPKPASGDAHQSNDADSSGLSSAPKTPPPHAHTAANDLELALALAESSSSSPLASVTSSPPAVRPSQMPTLSPLASPQLRAAEASLRRDRENSPKDSYPLREPSSDIDLVDFWAGIKHPGSQSQSSRLGSAGQTGLASSARQDKGKRVIKSEDQDHILDKDSKTRKGRRVSFKDGAGADISQPIDVDSLLVDSDGAHEPPRIKARPRSPTKKRKRAASPSVSLDGSPVRTSTPQPKRRKSRARSRLRHPSFWLLDGTVVVQVESMLFKLHRSRLVSESPYFAKLFGQRRAGEEDGDEKVEYEEEEGEEEEGERETIDSCPVYCVRHPHVTARDFEKVLAAMEDGM